LTVLGEFEPQNVVGHPVDPKNAYYELLCAKIHAWITSVGESDKK